MILDPLPLFGDRGLVFDEQLAFFDQGNFTGGTFRMQVRQVPDEGGSPLVSLTTTTSTTAAGVRLAYGGTDTIANHIAADRITEAQAAKAGYVDADTVELSVLEMRILSATMLGLPYPDELGLGQRGDNLPLAYDLLVTLPGGDEKKRAYGPFIVRPMVTQ